MSLRSPQHTSGMLNLFIVLRFVLFGTLVYLNILTLGFAAWNFTILEDLGLGVPVLGAPTFVIFNACLLVALVVSCCLAIPWLSSRTFDQVRYECAWTGLLSVLQLASSFDVTVNGPPVLCQGISITACASSSLTVALSWFSCMLVLLYAFSLMTSAITHMSIIPDIWTTSVRAVPWFVQPSNVSSLDQPIHYETSSREATLFDLKRLSFHYPTPIFQKHATALPPSPLDPPTFPTSPMSPMWSPSRNSLQSSHVPMERRTTWTSRLFSGVQTLSHKRSSGSFRPGWAKRTSGGRRGVDLPFAMPRFSVKTPPPVRPLRLLKLKSCWSLSTVSIKSPPPVPAVPPKACRSGPLDNVLLPTSTFYIDLGRDAFMPVRMDSRPISYGMFPEDVNDPDQPITRSRPSEWVHAPSETGSTKGSMK